VTATETKSAAYTLPVSTVILTQNLTVTTTATLPASTAFLTQNLTVTSTLPPRNLTITATYVPTTLFSASICLSTHIRYELEVVETITTHTSLFCRFSFTKTITEVEVLKHHDYVTVTETETIVPTSVKETAPTFDQRGEGMNGRSTG
jgi:hypothetical protein